MKGHLRTALAAVIIAVESASLCCREQPTGPTTAT